jgi:hypothetical protein
MKLSPPRVECRPRLLRSACSEMEKLSFLSYVLMALVACSNGPSGMIPIFSPSEPGGMPLAQLTADQVKTLCVEESEYRAMVASSPAGIETQCRANGWNLAFAIFEQSQGTAADSSLQHTCAHAYDDCLPNPPYVPTPGSTPPMCSGAANLADCSATVREYAACISAGEAHEQASTPPCDTLTGQRFKSLIEVSAEADGAVPAGPPACVALYAACPALAGVLLGSGD